MDGEEDQLEVVDENGQPDEIKPVLPEESKFDIATCSLEEFQKYMTGKYGEKQFKEGFSIIEVNSRIVYAQDGDGRLAVKLKDVDFSETERLQEFIKEASFYVVSNRTQF